MYMKSCILTIVWQKSAVYWKFLSWNSHDKIISAFYSYKNWYITSDTVSSVSCCHLCCHLWIWFQYWRWKRFEQNCSQQWDMGLWIQCGNKNSLFTMDLKKIVRQKKTCRSDWQFLTSVFVQHEFSPQGQLELLWLSQREKNRVVRKQHDSAPDLWLFVQNQHDSPSSATLLIWAGSSRLFLLLQTEIHFERMMKKPGILKTTEGNWRHKRKIAEMIPNQHTRIV